MTFHMMQVRFGVLGGHPHAQSTKRTGDDVGEREERPGQVFLVDRCAPVGIPQAGLSLVAGLDQVAHGGVHQADALDGVPALAVFRRGRRRRARRSGTGRSPSPAGAHRYRAGRSGTAPSRPWPPHTTTGEMRRTGRLRSRRPHVSNNCCARLILRMSAHSGQGLGLGQVVLDLVRATPPAPAGRCAPAYA